MGNKINNFLFIFLGIALGVFILFLAFDLTLKELILLVLSSIILVISCLLIKERKNYKKLLRIKKNLENLIHESHDAIITGNSKNYIVGWNNGAERIFGYKRNQALGKPWIILIPEVLHQVHLKEIQQFLEGKKSFNGVIELTGLRMDGTEFPLEVSISKWENVNEVYLTAIMRDITERKYIEDSLLESKNKAVEANKMKSDFLSLVSQEIRTPLTSILGFSGLLLTENAPEKIKSYINIIRHNGNYLLNIVNDFLDLIGMEINNLRPESIQCHVHTVINDVVALMDPIVQAKNLKIKVNYKDNIPSCFYSDPRRISQILFKVISKLVKLTNKGEIQIRVEVPKEHASLLKLTIANVEEGIDKNVITEHFEEFFKDSGPILRRFSEVGIELALVKNVTQLLGGNISFSKKENLGIAFTILIPICLEKEVPEELQMKSSLLQLTNKRILLVEDDEDIRRLMHLYLQHAGVLTDSVENGLEGYKKGMEFLKKDKPYDLIIMDIEMPIMTGLQAIKKLRDDGYQAPIIALTAHGTKEEENQCLEAGFNEVMVKPINRDFLIQKLQSYCIPIVNQKLDLG